MVLTLFCFILVVLIWLYFNERGRSKSLEDRVSTLDLLLINTNEELRLAAVSLAKLSRYESIVNAEEHAQKIMSAADADSQAVKEQSAVVRTNAEESARRLIEDAKEEAKKIAGDAYEALSKLAALEKTAKAMKNIIEGYGDQYLVPSMSLLDQLADDFSHTEGGEQLKRARDQTRAMIKSESAATCDYKEEYRRRTAIEFVLDAFNGKVDSVLTSVKEGNYGVLEQKVKDAFQTVNHNGSAFRNARISELYLLSRLNEVRWACTVQALKNRDKEEQRRIREQMREDDKASREIERVLREAQKEEESITKALAKAKKELETAKEEQKAKYEEKLAEIMNRLTVAEEKNRRALSMAQQTKRGHVYVISNIGSFGENVLKIGMTRRLDPMDRIWELGDASVPFDFDVHAVILSEDAPSLEKELHLKFSASQLNKVNPRKEFFKLEIKDVRQAVELLGVQTHWTMTAEAREYRESLAKERDKSAGTAA